MTPTQTRPTTRIPHRRGLARATLALGLAGLLGACNMAALPDFTQPAPSAPSGVDAGSQRAIAACLNRAEAQGFTVTGVSSATDMVGRDGRPSGQNVFVDVGRGGQSLTVRCSYSYATSEARIMTL